MFVRGQWHIAESGPVSFTDKEPEAYTNPNIPVVILLFLYQGSSIRRLGPVHYKLLPFEEFKFIPDVAGGILGEKFDGTKTMASRETYDLLRKSGALHVVEVGPGYVTREKSGTPVTDGR